MDYAKKEFLSRHKAVLREARKAKESPITMVIGFAVMVFSAVVVYIVMWAAWG